MTALRRTGLNTPTVKCSEHYARLVGQGWDTVQEAFALKPLPKFIDQLAAWKQQAEDIGDSLEGTVSIELNGIPFRVAAVGAKGGFKYRLESDDVIIFIGSPKRDWTISVRYLSAGLWEHGLAELRRRVFAALKDHCKQRDDDFIRTSRADYCFDLFSPQFSSEYNQAISGNVVCHSSTKKHDHLTQQFDIDSWTCGQKGETLTIGKKTGLQVQLYNKAKEITDISGKTWMTDIWVSNMDGEWPWPTDKITDVYRLEVRFSGDFLKDRNVRRPGEVNEHLAELITEALCNRRLTVPKDNDSRNRQRWPMHPIWERCLREFDSSKVLPIGRQVTGKRDALFNRAVLQMAGALRSATVLKFSDYSDGKVRDEVVTRALTRIEEDPEHAKKILAAQSRYSTVDEGS